MIQVHDELLFSVPEDELDECTADIRWAMEEMEGWGVPMLTDVKYGDRWGEVA
jgi:DNA polymerase I